MLYIIREAAGTSLAFTFKGMLEQLALCTGAEAAVFNLFGRKIAGRSVGA